MQCQQWAQEVQIIWTSRPEQSTALQDNLQVTQYSIGKTIGALTVNDKIFCLHRPHGHMAHVPEDNESDS